VSTPASAVGKSVTDLVAAVSDAPAIADGAALQQRAPGLYPGANRVGQVHLARRERCGPDAVRRRAGLLADRHVRADSRTVDRDRRNACGPGPRAERPDLTQTRAAGASAYAARIRLIVT
jgi:hypothetical protein